MLLGSSPHTCIVWRIDTSFFVHKTRFVAASHGADVAVSAGQNPSELQRARTTMTWSGEHRPSPQELFSQALHIYCPRRSSSSSTHQLHYFCFTYLWVDRTSSSILQWAFQASAPEATNIKYPVGSYISKCEGSSFLCLKRFETSAVSVGCGLENYSEGFTRYRRISLGFCGNTSP